MGNNKNRRELLNPRNVAPWQMSRYMETDDIKKKKWNTPTLIVLTRLEAGEAVLVGCKTSKGSGANVFNNKCGPAAVVCTGACQGNSGGAS